MLGASDISPGHSGLHRIFDNPTESHPTDITQQLSNRPLREAQILIEQWRIHYNTVRPHSALGYRPPAPQSIVPMDQTPMMH
jgi:transposase InsO family protein